MNKQEITDLLLSGVLIVLFISLVVSLTAI